MPTESPSEPTGTDSVPPRFLFRFSFPVSRVTKFPPKLALTKKYCLPDLSSIDGSEGFAELRAGWNTENLFFSIHLPPLDPRKELVFNSEKPDESDRLVILLDTRDTRTIHRASRFCHRYVVSFGDGSKANTPRVTHEPIARAKGNPSVSEDDRPEVRLSASKTALTLGLRFPKGSLTGYDPELSSKIGFCFGLRLSALGTQVLTVNERFPYESDPSLWSTLELIPD